jgi:hypothetical protein
VGTNFTNLKQTIPLKQVVAISRRLIVFASILETLVPIKKNWKVTLFS